MTARRDPFNGDSYPERMRRLAKEQERRARDTRPRAMTYRIGDALVDRINATATAYHVEKSALVRALLAYALDTLDQRLWVLKLPPKPFRPDE